MGGNRRHGRRSRVAAVGASAALLLGLSSCGEESGSTAGEAAAGKSYEARVVTADFPTRQRLGETALLRIGVRNTGEETIPELTFTVSIGGRDGRASSLPFAIRSREPGLAQPDRPVWVLSEKYPKAGGSTESAGAEGASRKTFSFGPLKAGAVQEAVWKLTASRTGTYDVLYEVGAGLSGEAKLQNASGVAPGGSFRVRIGSAPPETVVTDNGEVVQVRPGEATQANR